MDITVIFIGVLRELIKEETVKMHMPSEAKYSDLLEEIWHRFGSSIPDALWDGQVNAFKAPIMAIGQGRYLESPETPLIDGEEIKFLTLVAGG